jgi:hypothetical protein
MVENCFENLEALDVLLALNVCGVQIGFYVLLTFSFGGEMVARD